MRINGLASTNYTTIKLFASLNSFKQGKKLFASVELFRQGGLVYGRNCLHNKTSSCVIDIFFKNIRYLLQ